MRASLLANGLVLPRTVPPLVEAKVDSHITVEAALTPDPFEDMRVDVLVKEDEKVSQGQPLVRLRGAESIAFGAPMAGRVARITLNPGHKLSQLVLFHDAGGDRKKFDVGKADINLRTLLQDTGLWRAFRSRPFGRMPRADATPAAIFVMAVDSRPDAPAPLDAIATREDDFSRGLDALTRFFGAKWFLCEPTGRSCTGFIPTTVTRIGVADIHPHGLAGTLIHRHFPAKFDAPVWDIHAEDIADLGTLLTTGFMSETQLVSIAGDALRERKLVRCQKGANLRGLSQRLVRPGPHNVLSGSELDGRQSHWLAPHDRQVTVMSRATKPASRHWFRDALDRAARHAPIIPTAALEQALGGSIPAVALVRALATGDAETFTQLGGLSLIEEDLALADYATGARPRLTNQLRAMLEQIAKEGAA